MSKLKYGVNLPFGDYKFVSVAKPEECQDACAGENPCLAFTFVKAGIQGPLPVCWLKNIVPDSIPSDCCVSGVKENNA